MLSQDDAGGPDTYAELLDRAERAHAQVLLAAESGDGAEWQAFCRRQTDRALLVAEGPPPPECDTGADSRAAATCCWRGVRRRARWACGSTRSARPAAG